MIGKKYPSKEGRTKIQNDENAGRKNVENLEDGMTRQTKYY